MVAREPASCGQEMASTPANPTSSPRAWTRGRGRRSTTAQAAPASGTAPLSMPATDESTHCWATGNRISGRPDQMIPRKMTRSRSSRPIGRRAAGTRARAATPRATRATAITPGRSDSSPMSMNRNDDPQMRATLTSRAHSAAPKDPGRLPRPVSSSRRLAAAPRDGGEHLEGAVDVGLGVVEMWGGRSRPRRKARSTPAAVRSSCSDRLRSGSRWSPKTTRAEQAAPAWGWPARSGPGRGLDQPLDQLLVPGRDPLDAEAEQVLDRGRPGLEGEEVGRAEHVPAGGADLLAEPVAGVLAEVVLGQVGQPVGRPVGERGRQVGAEPAEAGPIGAAEPLEPAAHQRVHRQAGQVEGDGADGLGAVDDEGHPGPAAHVADRGQVDRVPAEENTSCSRAAGSPGSAPPPAGRRPASRRQAAAAAPAPPFGQRQPGHDGGREVAVDQQDLVPGTPEVPWTSRCRP